MVAHSVMLIYKGPSIMMVMIIMMVMMMFMIMMMTLLMEVVNLIST